jgi:hypothetical protein
MTKINVLKPFRFTVPADRDKGRPMPVEKIFTVGEHQIDKEMAAHPWMAAPNYADGHIESPQQAAARIAEQRAKAAQAKAVEVHAREQADAAVARVKRTQPERKIASEYRAEDLDTPVGVLRARMGGDDTRDKAP